MIVTGTRDFAKGELWLVPLGPELTRWAPESVTLPVQDDPQVVHKSLLCRAEVTGRIDTKAKNPDGEANGANVRYLVPSPLLKGKGAKARDHCFDNLAPFWAVPEAKPLEPYNNYNMVEETLVYEASSAVIHSTANGSKFLSLAKGTKLRGTVTVLRNVARIKKGDKLTRLSLIHI